MVSNGATSVSPVQGKHRSDVVAGWNSPALYHQIRNFCSAADSIEKALGSPCGRSKEFIMTGLVSRSSALLLMVTLAAVVACNAGDRGAVAIPSPATDAALAS